MICIFILGVGEENRKGPQWKKLNSKDLGISTSKLSLPTRKVLNRLKQRGCLHYSSCCLLLFVIIINPLWYLENHIFMLCCRIRGIPCGRLCSGSHLKENTERLWHNNISWTERGDPTNSRCITFVVLNSDSANNSYNNMQWRVLAVELDCWWIFYSIRSSHCFYVLLVFTD